MLTVYNVLLKFGHWYGTILKAVRCGGFCRGSGAGARIDVHWRNTMINELGIFSGWWSWVWIIGGYLLVFYYLSGNLTTQ